MIENGSTIGEKLRYHRINSNLTQEQLAEIVGFSTGSCIKDIEVGKKLPGREISQKLASYFKLETKYFYDEYLENTDNAKAVLKEYREKNNLTIEQACKKFGISKNAWSCWESGKNYVSRDKYEILKKEEIL